MRDQRRADAAALLTELGLGPRLTIYLASAPGAGKTHRLISDALIEARSGRRVAIGWLETKGRPQLDRLAEPLPRIAPRQFVSGGRVIEDFDFDAALASDYETIVLDEIAHANPSGARHERRWQDALALREAGKSVLGAFNVMHIDTVAPVAERILGHPVREIVPSSFLRRADRVIALDVAPSVLESRLRTGQIVRDEDVELAATRAFAPRNLEMLRELLLRVVDSLTIPVVAPSKVSTALAVLTPEVDAALFLRRCAAFAEALDLALEATSTSDADASAFREAVERAGGGVIPLPNRLARGDLASVRASLVIVPRGTFAERILRAPLDRNLLVADPALPPIVRNTPSARHPYGFILADRMRIGYGKLTIFLGSVAGSGKTYAMLERAHQLKDEGVDVVAALVETHGRPDTEEKLKGLEVIPRLPNGEMDVEAVLRRKPQVALIDELAHTRIREDGPYKRYGEVFTVLRRGIDVFTTLNVQHLEGVGDAVERLTATFVRETLPDSVLAFADEVIFIDVTPDVLRERLREGKVYPASRVETALANFFRFENLAALRELAVRELVHARSESRRDQPFARIVLAVAPRLRDIEMIERAGRLAQRLEVDLRVVTVVQSENASNPEVIAALQRATQLAKGTFSREIAGDAVVHLDELLCPGDLLIVESPRTRRRLFGPRSFASRALDAGICEMLVLSPRVAPASSEPS